MTDVETRFAAALRAAVHEHDAPAGIGHVAARRATRIRRRRRAAGGAAAAMAAVSSAVILVETRGEAGRAQLNTFASPSAVPSPPSLSTNDAIRLVYSHRCSDRFSDGRPADCVRIALETTTGDGPRFHELTDRRAPTTGKPQPQPRSLVVEYSDGSSREVTGHRADTDTWTFDIPPRPGERVVQLDIHTDDGQVQSLVFAGSP